MGKIALCIECVALPIGLFVVVMATAGCANQPPPAAYNPPGFFSGLIHGLLISLSLIGSIFMDIRIYAFPNSGFFYDLGYFLGVGIFLEGVNAIRKWGMSDTH